MAAAQQLRAQLEPMKAAADVAVRADNAEARDVGRLMDHEDRAADRGFTISKDQADREDRAVERQMRAQMEAERRASAAPV